MLLVISGLPGTGKSAVAVALADALGAVHLSIDTIEDALLGSGFPASWETGVAAYEAARAAAEQNLVLGRTVVVDAVNGSRPARDTWRTSPSRPGRRWGSAARASPRGTTAPSAWTPRRRWSSSRERCSTTCRDRESCR